MSFLKGSFNDLGLNNVNLILTGNSNLEITEQKGMCNTWKKVISSVEKCHHYRNVIREANTTAVQGNMSELSCILSLQYIIVNLGSLPIHLSSVNRNFDHFFCFVLIDQLGRQKFLKQDFVQVNEPAVSL